MNAPVHPGENEAALIKQGQGLSPEAYAALLRIARPLDRQTHYFRQNLVARRKLAARKIELDRNLAEHGPDAHRANDEIIATFARISRLLGDSSEGSDEGKASVDVA